MKDNVFLDTNIFIYALTEPKDKRDLLKRDVALSLLQKLVNEKNIFVSVQVINEIHINMVRKFKIEDEIVFRILQENISVVATVKSLTHQTYEKAFEIRQKYNISYWDSLVIASALEGDCSIIYSEDMQDDLLIDDKLRVLNPF